MWRKRPGAELKGMEEGWWARVWEGGVSELSCLIWVVESRAVMNPVLKAQ